MVLGSAWVSAQSFTLDGLTYSGNASDQTCFIQEAEASAVNIIIPATVSYNSVDYQVVSIGFAAFADCSALKSVSIPASVGSIANNAFAGCTSLTSLTISDSSTPLTVGYYHDYTSGMDRGMFYDCPIQTLNLGRNIDSSAHRFTPFSGLSELNKLTLGNEVTEISSVMFSGCSALKSVTIPESVSTIGASAFSGCSSLQSVTLPSGLTSIGASVFYRCTGLTSIVLPDALSMIEESAFANCSSLVSISFPSALHTIESSVFSGCESLSEVTIPESVTTLGSNVFSGCVNLKSVTLPSTLTAIDAALFSDCHSLSGIKIPESVVTIGSLAFSGCESLASLSIPASVSEIGNGAFTGCTALAKLTVEKSTEPLTFGFNTTTLPPLFAECPLNEVYLGREFNSPADASPFIGNESLKELTIGSDVSVIDPSVFNSCSSLTSFTIEDSDMELQTSAAGFENCPIEVINLGRNIKLTEEKSPFAGMSTLKKLNISSSVAEICSDLFRECSGLTWMSFPVGLKKIDGGAFADCSSLEGLTFDDGTDPIVISTDGAFSGSPIKSIYLGRNLSAETAPFSGLNQFKHLTIGSGVTSIAPRTFRGCPALTRLTIEQGTAPLNIEEPVEEDTENTLKTLDIARNITGCGFRNFYNLTTVTVYDGITTIGANLFEGCNALKTISLPGSVNSIGDFAFANCTSLRSIGLPSSLSAIGEGAFIGCSSLKAIALPSSLTTISDGAFARCSGLTDIEFPSSITTIGEYAFAECTVLTAVEIPESITKIGRYAFADCSALTTLKIADSDEPVTINRLAFRNNINQPADNSTLETIYIGREVEFTDSPFAEMDNLKSVTVGNSVANLGASLFQACPNLTHVKLGTSLKTIEEFVFLGCGALRSVRSESMTPPSAIQSAFPDDTYRFGTLYVPEESLTLYQTTAPWDLFRQVSTEPESGLQSVEADSHAEIYNLQGIKLTSKPANGLYIQNGKICVK